jgi:hypothetical protein
MSTPFTPTPTPSGHRRRPIIILVDDEEREKEGDFIFAASMPPRKNHYPGHPRPRPDLRSGAQDRLRHFGLGLPRRKNTALLGTTSPIRSTRRHNVSPASRPRSIQTVRVMADPASPQ